MISSINGWQHRRLDFCVLYLVGDAKIWFEIREPATWAESRTRFLTEFRRADTRDRLEAELKNRRQGRNESVRPYFYNMLMLIKKLERETGESMSVPEKLEHLLNGLNQDLYWRMAPLIPDQIVDTDEFLSAVNRFEMIEHRARSLSKSSYTEIPDQIPSRRKREEIDSLGSELIKMMKGLQLKMEDLQLEQDQMKRRALSRPQPSRRNHYDRYGDTDAMEYKDDHYDYHEEPSRPPRRPEPRSDHMARRRPRPEFMEPTGQRQKYADVNRPRPSYEEADRRYNEPKTNMAEPSRKFQPNRTSDGKPICHNCKKPGHLARHCPKSHWNGTTKPMNMLRAKGQSLVTETVLINGTSAVALIDTGAAISAVSDAFAQQFPNDKCNWDGPAVSMANCKVVRPKYGLKVELEMKGKQLSGIALILPLPQTDMLIGNDILRQFRNVEISYVTDPEDAREALHRAKISLKQDIVIPPQSSAPINVIVQPDVTIEGKTWVVEPSKRLLLKKGVSLGHSIITSLGQVVATNLTNQHQTLVGGTSLATMEELRTAEINTAAFATGKQDLTSRASEYKQRTSTGSTGSNPLRAVGTPRVFRRKSQRFGTLQSSVA